VKVALPFSLLKKEKNEILLSPFIRKYKFKKIRKYKYKNKYN